jgi:hypothetical protein
MISKGRFCNNNHGHPENRASIRADLLTIINTDTTTEKFTEDMKRKSCESLVSQTCAIKFALKAFCQCFIMNTKGSCIYSIRRRRLNMAEWIRKANLRMELRKKDQYMCRGAPFLFKWGRRIPLNAEKKREI